MTGVCGHTAPDCMHLYCSRGLERRAERRPGLAMKMSWAGMERSSADTRAAAEAADVWRVEGVRVREGKGEGGGDRLLQRWGKSY